MNAEPYQLDRDSASYALRYDNQSDHPMEVAGILRAMMPADVRVLDVGCGTGSVTLIANTGRANEVFAIEPNYARAMMAASRGISVHHGVLDEEFIATHDAFEVVMTSDVLEHTEHPAGFLLKIREALVDEGTLLISVPNVAHWSVRANLLFGRFNYEPTGIMDETHLRWFTEATFRNLLASCGFEILEFQHTAGVDLSVYCHSKLRHLPKRVRDPAVRRATRAFPRLFGVQHVVKARKSILPRPASSSAA